MRACDTQQWSVWEKHLAQHPRSRNRSRKKPFLRMISTTVTTDCSIGQEVNIGQKYYRLSKLMNQSSQETDTVIRRKEEEEGKVNSSYIFINFVWRLTVVSESHRGFCLPLSRWSYSVAWSEGKCHGPEYDVLGDRTNSSTLRPDILAVYNSWDLSLDHSVYILFLEIIKTSVCITTEVLTINMPRCEYANF